MKIMMMMVARKSLDHKTLGALGNSLMITAHGKIRKDLTIPISPSISSWIQEREAGAPIMTDKASL